MKREVFADLSRIIHRAHSDFAHGKIVPRTAASLESVGGGEIFTSGLR